MAKKLAALTELLSSMRFAVSLLSFIAIACIIGTVLPQHQPMTVYVDQFGPFWSDIFAMAGVYAVYSSWWFLLIMAFLVVSTTLCLVRNAPKMLREAHSWQDKVREQSLRNFPHRAEWTMDAMNSYTSYFVLAKTLSDCLHQSGYQTKIVDKAGQWLITAKQGTATKWGYILAHGAIVMIFVGGLLDSDLSLRIQQWTRGKTPFTGSGLVADIPSQHRLSSDHSTFRGHTQISEGGASNITLLPQSQGVMIQELPFTIHLKKFIIEYYSTGMPKLFASEVIVRDHADGRTFPATIKVNEPLIYKNIAVYQSSFEDGGSTLNVRAYPMTGASNRVQTLTGKVGTRLTLQEQESVTLEWSGFRAFNIENMANVGDDLRAVTKLPGLHEKLTGAATRGDKTKDLKNIGPSFQYTLRDSAGQAREFDAMMQPVQIADDFVFLAGVRDRPDQPFQYLRIPADDDFKVDEWMRLRAALHDPLLRNKAASRYAQEAIAEDRDQSALLRMQLQQSASHGLGLFAEGGYVALSRFLEKLPEAEQEKAATIFMKVLNGSVWALWQVARLRDGLSELTLNDARSRFLVLATHALSDAHFYAAPLFLQLDSFDEVKASVFQVTRSPGKSIVYLGSFFLVLGLFCMLYVRQRRLWVWIRPRSPDEAHILMAMSTQRKTMDFEKEYEAMCQLLRLKG